MPYDQTLEKRVRAVLERAGRAGITDKKMFGGLAFLLGGKMFCGIVNDDLMVRVGVDRHGEALENSHARPMDFTGRPMNGYVFVAPAGYATDEQLAEWVDWGASVVADLEEATTAPERARPHSPTRRR